MHVPVLCKSLLIAAFLSLSLPAWASVSTQGHGRISVAGSIIDTACAIATESREQYVEIGDVPFEQLARDGQGPSRPFSIQLINCVLTRSDPTRPNWETFEATFEGVRDDQYFGAQGSASGVALKITDADGNTVTPGEVLRRRNIHPKEMRLNYYITPVTSGQVLKPGDYSSLIKFKLDYF